MGLQVIKSVNWCLEHIALDITPQKKNPVVLCLVNVEAANRMWLAQFVCAPQFFKTPKGLCEHTVYSNCFLYSVILFF
jgi:hypothetical protein